MRRYYADWRFLLQADRAKQGAPAHRARLLGLRRAGQREPAPPPGGGGEGEPDRLRGTENSIAGWGCMIARDGAEYAPNALVGLYASAWGKMDGLSNTNASFDVAGEARKLGTFLIALGARTATS